MLNQTRTKTNARGSFEKYNLFFLALSMFNIRLLFVSQTYKYSYLLWNKAQVSDTRMHVLEHIGPYPAYEWYEPVLGHVN